MALLSDGNDPSRFPREKGCLGEYPEGIIIGTSVGMRISSHEHNVSIPSTSPLKKVGQELTKVSGSVVPKLTCRREQYHRIRYGRVYGLILLPGLIWNNREFRDSSPESRDRTEITGRSDIHSGLHLNRNLKHQGIQGFL